MPHILVVEDDWKTYELFCILLEADGYEVSVAQDALSALAVLCDDSLPGLIILDVMLPEMDGIALCEAIRAQNSTAEIPILMVSAKIDLQSQREGLAAGANAYLVKPVLKNDLLAKVRTLLVPFPTRAKAPDFFRE